MERNWGKCREGINKNGPASEFCHQDTTTAKRVVGRFSSMRDGEGIECRRKEKERRRRRREEGSLGEIVIDLAIGLGAFQVLALDEGLDSLLDDQRVGHEARGQLLGHLRHEVRVVHRLSRLHDTHNRCLNRTPVKKGERERKEE